MRFRHTLETAYATLREVVRVFGLPIHIALHALSRKTWTQAAQDALHAPPAQPGEQLERFLAQHPPKTDATGSGHLFISAGEASGENHAVKLVHATRALTDGRADSPRFSAFGGQGLRDAGAEVCYPLSENALMGIAGVLRALPFVIRAFYRYLQVLDHDRPSLVVLVDYPGFHLVMARAAKRRGIPVLHYIAPQYWGWGPWRMQRYRKSVDATLTILPFEAAFYARFGIPAEYVGHPLLDELATMEPPEPEMLDSRPLLCIMPGSRRLELEQHLAPMVEIARRLHAESKSLSEAGSSEHMRIVLPHRDPKREPLIREQLAACDPEGLVEFQLGEPKAWLGQARAVLVKSGTGSLEATLCGAPTVVVYVLKSLYRRFGYRSLLNVPWFAGANLIAAREVAKEIPIFVDDDWASAFDALRAIWIDGDTRNSALDGVLSVRERLGDAGASARAARWTAPYC